MTDKKYNIIIVTDKFNEACKEIEETPELKEAIHTIGHISLDGGHFIDDIKDKYDFIVIGSDAGLDNVPPANCLPILKWKVLFIISPCYWHIAVIKKGDNKQVKDANGWVKDVADSIEKSNADCMKGNYESHTPLFDIYMKCFFWQGSQSEKEQYIKSLSLTQEQNEWLQVL